MTNKSGLQKGGCFLILLTLMISMLFSCASVSPGTADTESAESAKDMTETAESIESSLLISGHPVEEFTIIRPENAGDDVVKVCSEIYKSISELYGFKPGFKTDDTGAGGMPDAHEIVLGMSRRDGVPELAGDDSACISVKGGRLYITARRADILSALFDLFTEQWLTGENGIRQLSLEEGFMKTFEGQMQIRRADGEKIKADDAFSAYDFGVT